MDAAINKKICDYFATQPVLKAWVFGSYARGEEREDSDIDLLVQFDRENAKVGLFKYASIVKSIWSKMVHCCLLRNELPTVIKN